MRDIINTKKKIPETIAAITSYPINGKLPAKQVDIGIPTISYAIGMTDIRNALCDLGAVVSVMAFSLLQETSAGRLLSYYYNLVDG